MALAESRDGGPDRLHLLQRERPDLVLRPRQR
jgi:hypothetical protein